MSILNHGSDSYDIVIVGGGIGGSALAAVMSRAGKSVLVLERATAYRDRVRGEYMQPWGVAEAQRLGVHETLLDAGGAHHSTYVPYDETLEPAEAEAAAVALSEIIPNVPGSLGVGHPQACEALSAAARANGATVHQGAETGRVDPSTPPVVHYQVDGVEREARCRLLVGADGRQSLVRRLAGIDLHATVPRLLGAGLRVAGMRGWPEHQASIGTEDDRVFFVLPQAGGFARLYLMYSPDQRQRFSGPNAPSDFLECLQLECFPEDVAITEAMPAGPCAEFPMNDTWTETPLAPGLALIGDAAGYSDPHIGQGLSVALRDVRILSEILLSGEDWSEKALQPFATERSERMRRLRFCNDVATSLRGTFGEEARQRRRRARAAMETAPELALWRKALWAGPETVPHSAFDDGVRTRLVG